MYFGMTKNIHKNSNINFVLQKYSENYIGARHFL